MRKLYVCLLGFAASGSLLGAFWLLSAERAPAPSSAVEERHDAGARSAPPRANRSAQRSAADATNMPATTATDPVVAAHSLIDAMSEDEPAVDLAWEERLSMKPESVVRFFHQRSATLADWAGAYRADICACASFECVTALQDDFVSRAPPFTDMRQDEQTSAEIRAAIACANRHVPTPSATAELAADGAAPRTAGVAAERD